MNLRPLWKIAGYALVLAACATGIERESAAFAPAPPAEESTFTVRNDYFGEVDIFIVAGNTRARIGTVSTAGTAKLRIPRVFLARSEIQFQIDPVGPVAPFTYRPISFAPGNAIELSIAPALHMSAYSIVLGH